MNWKRISINTEQGELMEKTIAILLKNGISGLEINDSCERSRDVATKRAWDYADEALLADTNECRVIFYLQHDSCEHLLEKITQDLQRAGLAAPIMGYVNESSWENKWKEYFKPIQIGNVVIVPAWEEYHDDGILIKLDSGAAFGTGQHESTQLVLRLMQDYVMPGHQVLDIGCGSGILSCAASLLGAVDVKACDLDPVGAMDAIARNAWLNGIENIEAFVCDALTGLDAIGGSYDVVLANIVADVVIDLVPKVASVIKESGIFISSGIIDERAEEVVKALEAGGFKIGTRAMENGWVALASVYTIL